MYLNFFIILVAFTAFQGICCNYHQRKGPGSKEIRRCYNSGISNGQICTQAFTTFCSKDCKRCCSNNNGCVPNRRYRYKMVGEQCTELDVPLPRCYKKATMDGQICTQALTTFCNKRCTKCCVNNDGCIPNKIFRKTKSECNENTTERPCPVECIAPCLIPPCPCIC